MSIYSSSDEESIGYLHRQLDELSQKLSDLQRLYDNAFAENLELRADNERIVTLEDIKSRACRNPKIPHASYRLYCALLDLYPALIDGLPAEYQAHRLREVAGWTSEKTVTTFMRALVEIIAITYDSGTYNDELNERKGRIIPNEEIFPYPESFDLRSTKDAKKARETEAEKRKAMKAALLIVECRECGSHDLLYDVTAKCKECGHVHEPVKDIPADLLTADLETSFEEFMVGMIGDGSE